LIGGIPGYIVISIIGLVPLVYLWLRGDRTFPFPRRTQPVHAAVAASGAQV
jgi:hypothetical protein